jgi:hypothetical protein
MQRFHESPPEYSDTIAPGAVCIVYATDGTPEEEYAQRFVVTQIRERFKSGCPKRIVIEHPERREQNRADWQRHLYYSTSKKRWFCKAIDGLRHPIWNYHFE